jgi:hypothetical protein
MKTQTHSLNPFKTLFTKLVTAFRKQPCALKIVLKVVCDCEYVSKASCDIFEVKESRNRNSDAAIGTSSRISKCFQEAGRNFEQSERELI